MSSDDCSDSDDDGHIDKRKGGDDDYVARQIGRNKQSKEEQLYGVFYESGGESPPPSSSLGNKRRRDGGKPASAGSGITFVAKKEDDLRPPDHAARAAENRASSDEESQSAPPQFGKGNSSQFRQFLGAGSAGLAAAATEVRVKAVEKPAWEKHTKGFGMKMLMKLGYAGGGLGKDGGGISRHIEASTARAGGGKSGRQGLGSVNEGNANNKAVERELRGEKAPSDDDATEDRARRRGRLRSAAEETAEEGLWRKTEKEATKKQSKRPKYVTVEEVLARDQDEDKAYDARDTRRPSVVVDMRGPQTKLLSDLSEMAASAGPPLLGAELLHNLSLHVDLAEAHIRAFDQEHKAHVERAALLQREAAALRDRVLAGSEQMLRFRELEALLVGCVTAEFREGKSDPRDPVSSVSASASALARVETFRALSAPRFSTEFALFGMAQLGPDLLRPMLELEAKAWAPLKDPGFAGRLLGQWRERIVGDASRSGARDASKATAWGLEAFHAVADEVVTSKARTALLGSWDLFGAPSAGVALVEALLGFASDASVSDLLTAVILPKLTRALDSWDPRTAHTSPQWRMDLWLHPWLPFLAAELGALFPAVRRKLIAAIGPCDCSDPRVSAAHLALVGPWLGVLGSSAEGVAAHVCGKLASQVRAVEVNPADQRLNVLDAALSWAKVLPKHHMSCLVRGELLPSWHAVLLGWLKRSDGAANADLVSWYKGWKQYLTDALDGLDGPLRAELGFGLDLMAAARRLPRGSALDALHDTASRPNYHALLKALNSAPAPAPAPRSRGTSHSSFGMASFKEVVAAFAEAEGVVFALKALKSEGRPLYAFGGLTVLLEHDVAHVEEAKGKWRPVSLEELRERAR